MNLNIIDDFLYSKSEQATDHYFSYLQRGFELIDLDAAEVPKDKEHFLTQYFGKEVIPYQVIATSFINEVFHIVEAYLKSNLLRVGEYLVYPSIDKYPEHRERLDKFNERQSKEITNFLVSQAKSSVKNKEDRFKEISKKVGSTLFVEEKEIIVNSISCSEALYRLEKYLGWTISVEAKERFYLFIENRNDIIHFNKLTNLTFACSHSLFVLLNLCSSNSSLYPKFSSLEDHLMDKIVLYNILLPEILFATELDKAFKKIEVNVGAINEAINTALK